MPMPCVITAATNRTAACPPMHPVEDLLPDLANAGLPLVAIHIPKTGAPSRKERDELKASGQERGLRVYDDAKRLERDFPEAMAKVRERCGAGENDLLLLAAWAGEPKGQRPEETVYQACGPVAPLRRAEVQRPPQAARSEKFSVPLGSGLPHVRMGRRGQPLECGAPSVHLGARRRPGKADGRPGTLPRQILRPGAERHGTGIGIDSYSPARRTGQGVRARSGSPKKKRTADSDSCWTRWSMAPRHTVESRWVWTGW